MAGCLVGCLVALLLFFLFVFCLDVWWFSLLIGCLVCCSDGWLVGSLFV